MKTSCHLFFILIYTLSASFSVALANETQSKQAAEAHPNAVVPQNPVVVHTERVEGGFKAEYLRNIELPPGFSIEVYADEVPGARSMALGDKGTLFVGTRGKRSSPGRIGSVYAVVDNNNDKQADKVIELTDSLL